MSGGHHRVGGVGGGRGARPTARGTLRGAAPGHMPLTAVLTEGRSCGVWRCGSVDITVNQTQDRKGI